MFLSMFMPVIKISKGPMNLGYFPVFSAYLGLYFCDSWNDITIILVALSIIFFQFLISYLFARGFVLVHTKLRD